MHALPKGLLLASRLAAAAPCKLVALLQKQQQQEASRWKLLVSSAASSTLSQEVSTSHHEELVFPTTAATSTCTGASPKLRDYQARLLAEVRAAFQQAGQRRVLMVLPTGAGKTVCFAALAQEYRQQGNHQVMVVVHRRELVMQAKEHLQRWGMARVGVIISNEKPDYGAPVQVVAIQSWSRRKQHTGGLAPGLIIVDEAHHSTADSYAALAASFPDAHILGVTATPYRLDGKGLHEYYDVMVQGPTIAELITSAQLVPPGVVPPQGVCLDLTGVKKSAFGDFKQDQLVSSVATPLLMRQCVSNFRRCVGGPGGRQAVVYAVNVDHSQKLCDEFEADGYAAAHISGMAGKAERDRIMSEYKEGKIQVLVNCEIVTEGYDVPNIGAVVLMRPTKSRALFMQMVGRGLRPSPGKEDCIILDMVGNTLYHGSPTDPYPLSLDMQPDKKRDSEYKWKFDTRPPPPPEERDDSSIKILSAKQIATDRIQEVREEFIGDLEPVDVARSGIGKRFQGLRARDLWPKGKEPWWATTDAWQQADARTYFRILEEDLSSAKTLVAWLVLHKALGPEGTVAVSFLTEPGVAATGGGTLVAQTRRHSRQPVRDEVSGIPSGGYEIQQPQPRPGSFEAVMRDPSVVAIATAGGPQLARLVTSGGGDDDAVYESLGGGARQGTVEQLFGRLQDPNFNWGFASPQERLTPTQQQTFEVKLITAAQKAKSGALDWLWGERQGWGGPNKLVLREGSSDQRTCYNLRTLAQLVDFLDPRPEGLAEHEALLRQLQQRRGHKEGWIFYRLADWWGENQAGAYLKHVRKLREGENGDASDEEN